MPARLRRPGTSESPDRGPRAGRRGIADAGPLDLFTPKGFHLLAQGRAAHPGLPSVNLSPTPKGFYLIAQGRAAHPGLPSVNLSPTPKGFYLIAQGRVAHP